jgi:Holliday junction resolvase-like predicted endonuclease
MIDDKRDGVAAERLVKKMLQSEGWQCLPARHQRINKDSAEIIEGDDEVFRNPDIFAMGHGEALFVEVKQFKSSVMTRVRGQREHGIRQPKFEDYKSVSDASGIPLWIFILESGAGRVLASKISDLSELDPISASRCREEYGELLTYFPRSEMQEVSVKHSHVPNSFSLSIKTGKGQRVTDVLHGVETEGRKSGGNDPTGKTSITDFVTDGGE